MGEKLQTPDVKSQANDQTPTPKWKTTQNLFLTDLRRQEPKKFSFLGFEIYIDQRYASLGEFERRPG